MNTKARILSIITYAVITILLIILFDYIWPHHKVESLIIPLVVGGLITHFIRKAFDYISDAYNRIFEKPFLGVSIETNNIYRKFIGYGASCGEVIQAGNYKADYKVEIELNVTIQNESSYTAYELDVSYTPNHYSNNYIIIDSRQNKLQPLEGNKHIEFKLRIIKYYNDVYASDIDNETQKIGKESSPLNGSVLYIRYQDSKHEGHIITKVLK